MPRNALSHQDYLNATRVVLCSGLENAASRPPKIATPEFYLDKENSMKKKILITYATRAGSTSEIALAIGETLRSCGFCADVVPVKAKPALKSYDAVIIGSAIRMGSWLPEAVEFIRKNQGYLNTLPVALFMVHMMNTGDDEDSRTARLSYLDDVRPLIGYPVEEVFFEGKMDLSKLSFLDMTIAKMIKPRKSDKRDWDQIYSWAEAIPSLLALSGLAV